eukprot:Opistho-2@89009
MDKDKDLAPLNAAIIRGLNDKLYDKRKTAALEIERIIKDLVTNKDLGKIGRVLAILRQEFAYSPNPNSRKGGLIGLAATAIALGAVGDINAYLEELVAPVLSCFSDVDSRVRYYACESIYNIAKVARPSTLLYFNEIFDALSKLAADPDTNVKSGAELLDRLVKDIVTESTSFNIKKFIPLLRERIAAVDPFVRQFLVSWVTVLDSVPDIELVEYLPDFLDGLFRILSDNSREIHKQTEAALGEFLRELQQHTTNINYARLIEITVIHCASKDQLTQFTALTWIQTFITMGKAEMLPFNAQLLGAILPCLAHNVDKIRETAVHANQMLVNIVVESESTATPDAPPTNFSLGPTVNVLALQLLHESVETRIAALRWILMLHVKARRKIFALADEMFPALLKTLSDPADKVVLLDLEVLAEISSQTDNFDAVNLADVIDSVTTGTDDASATKARSLSRRSAGGNAPYFMKFMTNLLLLFSTDRDLLEKRGSFIIRQLCVLLSPVRIYSAVADILLREEDLEFASLMVQNLTLILLTSTELFELRNSLKHLKTPESRSLFCSLYRSFCHNPVSTFSLCLLAQTYKHCSNLIEKFADLEITVGFLVE